MASSEFDSERLDLELVRGWFDVFVEQRCVCQYCGFDGTRTAEDWVQLQGDHLIPRHIARPNKENPLNRVIACGYCNGIKRRFNPAPAGLVEVPSREVQRELIEATRVELRRKKSVTWRHGGGLQESYDLMMRSLRS